LLSYLVYALFPGPCPAFREPQGDIVSYSIQKIEGIAATNAKKLAKANIKTTGSLLKLCCDRKGRKAVAESTGIGEKVLLKWANMADLMRIKGVGEEYSELLEAAGVDTVKELRRRKADNLAVKMAAVNSKKKLVRKVPTTVAVAGWVEQAAGLEPLITH
jgi:predicted flap endonuclease-1-like 5' DNA nuclease